MSQYSQTKQTGFSALWDESDLVFISQLKLLCDYLLHSIHFYKLILLVSLLHPLPILKMPKNYMELSQINIGLGVSNWIVVVTTILYSSTVSSIVFQYIACIILQQGFREFLAAESLLQIHSILTGRQDISRGWLETSNKRKKSFPLRDSDSAGIQTSLWMGKNF